ncbi:MAG TPA: hypothetical protein VJ799_05225 [Nitrososphaeraceae archaeon]|uniref:hypothetical protein n=1 Tax=Pedobacter ginsengisoli TaxID=363852 RepID=UPI001FE321D4|nr:hypothetical protein [Pedobacter ginsengisoli]HJR47538.1 hypothetical protein [Nitrososphaeraceae archaeon]
MKTLLILFVLFVNISVSYAQDRIQTLGEGIALLGTSKQHITEYLKNKDFSKTNSYKNIYDYGKGEFTYSVGYELDKVVVVSWNEYIGMYNSILGELISLNFQLIKPKNGTYTSIFRYENIESNILITVIVGKNINKVIVYPKDPSIPIKIPTKKDDSRIETPVGFRKFTDLIVPEDDEQKTGKIAVRIKIEKSGNVIDATAGVKGTTLNDKELWRKCEEALMRAHLVSSETAPDIQIGVIVFNFKVK